MEVKDEYVADVSRYSGPLREAAKEADRFGDKNEQAALAARRMGLAAKEAAEKAGRAQKDAADAAEKLAKGELKADEAARAAAKAETELERASIKAAEAQRAAGRAADTAADNFRQLARDAALGAAAENLAMLKASGSVREHNAEVLRLRKEMPQLGKDGSQAFTLMTSTSRRFGSALDGATSSFSNLSGMGRAVPGLILAGIQLLPAAAAVAGGAITLGLGGALSFIGLKAQMSNKDVQKSFHQTRAAITDDLHHISEPFHKTLLTISADAKRTFLGLSPSLEGAFAKMAPAISRFSSSFGDALQELDPMIDSLGTAFSRTLDALGSRAPAIMNNFGTSIKAITDAVAANPQALASFVQDISELTRYAGDAVGVLIRYSDAFKTAFETANAFAMGPVAGAALSVLKMTHAIRDSGSGFQVVEKTFPTFAQQAIVAAAGAHQLMTAQQAATLSSQQLKSALDALTGANQSSFDATTAYRQALMAANAQAKASNAGISGMGKAALANRSALSQMAGAIRNVMQNSNPTSAAIANMRNKFISAAQGMGVSRSAAVALANKLLGVRDSVNRIPKSHTTKVTANTSGAMSNLDRFLATVNRIPTHRQLMIDVRYNGVRPDLAATGGQYMGPGKGFKYAGGGEVSGLISGPGSGTSDSIPAPWLSDGEFVTREKVTRDHTAALMNLNAGMSWMRAGLLGGEKFAKGGKVSIGKMEQKQIARLHAAQARVDLARARPEYLAAMAAQQALASMRSSVYGGILRGGSGGPGTGGSTVVQHVTNVNVTVQGSVAAAQDLAKTIQRQLLTNRMPVSLPAGR